MLNNTFFLDGVDAQSMGIILQHPIQFDGLTPIITRQHIPGRNGDLIFDTGAFQNRAGQADCYALHTDVLHSIDAASAFLLDSPGYRRLECSDDPEHFWLARIENGAQIEQRMRLLNPFEIKFDCKPQRFEKCGEFAVTFTGGGSLYNRFSGVALPLITAYGNGAGTVTVNNVVVEIKSMNGKIILDSDTQNAYDDIGNNANLNIKAAEFPRFTPGDNSIDYSGKVYRLEIIPRWWSK